jgi:DNA-binding NarL/FixJ family response regulator
MTRTATFSFREAPATLVVADGSWPGLARAVASGRELRLVAPSDPGLDLVSAASRLRPHVALLDGRSSDLLVEMLRQLRLRAPETRALVVSECCDPPFVAGILRQGASGCIHPSASPDAFARAVLAARGGQVWLERRVLADVLGHVEAARDVGAAHAARLGETLTRREHEIVAWVAKGLTNKGIARELGVSHETVKKHLKKVFAKLGVHHRFEVILQHHG